MSVIQNILNMSKNATARYDWISGAKVRKITYTIKSFDKYIGTILEDLLVPFPCTQYLREL